MNTALRLLLQDSKTTISAELAPGQISSNVFTIAGKKIQSHNPNTYYQLGPTVRSIIIHESQTVFYSAAESYNGKQHLEEKPITHKNLIVKQ